MIAINRAGKCDAGKLAFDCVVFCTAWPVSHLTLLAHWVERRRSNCNCYYLLLLRDSRSFDAALHAMVANMAFRRRLNGSPDALEITQRSDLA